MMNRMFFLAALATSALFAADAHAQSSANFFSSYTQTGSGDAFTYTRTAVGLGGPLPASIKVADPIDRTVGVDVTFAVNDPSYLITPGPLAYQNAKLFLTGSSSDAATTTVIAPGLNIHSQAGFSGSFEIVSTGNEILLSGTFTNGTLSQFSTAPNQASLTLSPADFTSEIFKPLTDEGFSISLSGGFGLVSPDSGAFQDFSAGTSATFTAAVIPEPATLAMAGLGVIGLPIALRVIRRRRSGSSN